MIKTPIKKLRDPFVLVENGVYYVYGTNIKSPDITDTEYACYYNDSGLLQGEYKRVLNLYEHPQNALNCFWAPEVHKYNGAFYMFASYLSKKTNHRGVAIFKADCPKGPFKEITNGTITNPNFDAIDGTLYIDEENKPWLVFVDEKTSREDGIGRMAVARLSDDLTKIITEPKILFKSTDPVWSNGSKVTDGPFMHKTQNGTLYMLWSSGSKEGYCVGLAKSKNGKIDGDYEQLEERLFVKGELCENDGGHGMIFKAIDGKKYLSIHSPNASDSDQTPTFFEIYEENDRIYCKK